MHASPQPSLEDEDDPILRQMEADLRSPAAAAASLQASRQYEQRRRQQPHHAGTVGGLGSLFSRAMSLAGTPSHPSAGSASASGVGAGDEAPGFFGFSSSAASTPTRTPTGSSSSGIRGRMERVVSLDRPSGAYGGSVSGSSFLSPRPRGHQRHAPSSPSPGTCYENPSGRARVHLSRQRSLESSESLSPAGPPQMSRFPMGTSSGAASGRLTRGISESGRMDFLPGSSLHPSPRVGAPVRRGILTRGVSMGSSAPAFPNSASFHTGPVSAHLSTSVGRNMGSSGYLGGPVDRFHLETASAPEDVAEIPRGRDLGRDGSLAGGREMGSLYPRVLVSDSEARDLCPPMLDTKAHSDHGTSAVAGVISGTRTRTVRRKLDATFRNDSLSSDQSECVQRPHPPRPHKSKRRLPSTTGMRQTGRAAATVAAAAAVTPPRAADGATVGGRRKRGTGGSSFASSSEEDEVRSTPDYTSCGEEMESESISEKGKTFIRCSKFRCPLSNCTSCFQLASCNSLPSARKVAFKAVELFA